MLFTFRKLSLVIAVVLLISSIACNTNPTNQLNAAASKKEKAGIADGLDVKYFSKTKIKASEITYKKGLKNGLARNFYENGSVHKEGNYLNGKKHGKFTTYFENGTLKKVAEYDYNSRQGWDSLFYKSGNPKSAVLYDYGVVQVGTVEWDRYKKKHSTKNIIKVKVVNRVETHGESAVFVKLEKGYQVEKIYMASMGSGTIEKPEFKFLTIEWTDSRKVEAMHVFKIPKGLEYVDKLVFRVRGKTKNNRPFVSYLLYPVVLN